MSPLRACKSLAPALLLVALVGLGHAAELAPERLVTLVEDLYAPAGAPRAPGISGLTAEQDAHVLIRRAHRLLEEDPDSPEAARLRPYLTRPDPGRPSDAPGAPEAGARVFCTPHFKILYYTEGEDAVSGDDDGDGRPDKVQWVADAFEHAYSREVETFGYPAPPDIPDYTVVLKRLRVNALTHPEGNSRTWCEFNFGMREGSSPELIQQKFRAVAAHEFFHAVQATLNWHEEDWWTEGSADWMSELVDPGNGFYRSNAALRLERPEVGLTSDEPFFAYAGSLMAAYLTPAAGKGEDLVQKVWFEIGNLARSAEASGSRRRTFVRDAFERCFGSFEEVVVRFWPHVYLRDFPGGKELPRATRVRVKEYPAEVAPDTAPRPDQFGANFFEFHPSAGHEHEALRLEVIPEASGSRFAARLIVMGAEDWRSIPLRTREDGRILTSVPGLGGQWRAATLVVVNLARKKSGFRVKASFVPVTE